MSASYRPDVKNYSYFCQVIIIKRFIFVVSVVLLPCLSMGQHAVIEGIARDSTGQPLEFVNVAIEGTAQGTSSNEQGFFRLRVEAGKDLLLNISYLGFTSQQIALRLDAGELHRIDIVLHPTAQALPDVVVMEQQILSTDITRIDPRLAPLLPGPTASVEGLVKTLPGVSSVSELSTQYSVRGGNFDENLVYVNGIEIYRPFLVRSGQQEGLSFLNSDLVAAIGFSAGGFDARYGDKMSSVLDIQYKTPEAFQGSFSMSLLEGSLHLEGLMANERISYLFGFRHKSNQYLLGTLDTKGDYKPSFSDIQTLISYRLSESSTLSFLGNYSHNRYLFQPTMQSTRFGTVSDVRQFTVYFDGQEVDQFITSLGALTLNIAPNNRLNLDITSTVFQSDEREQFDIQGAYWLRRVETDFGEDDFGQPTGKPLGVGAFHNHARNYLNAIVWNVEHKGQWQSNGGILRWGLKFQHEDIIDRLKEWSLIDSSGYVIPRAPEHLLLLRDTLNARIHLQSNRVSSFLQHTWNLERDHGRFAFTAGLRTNYWNFNDQWLISPRLTILYKPVNLPRWAFRASAGAFHQPPFYRELRNLQGELNKEIKAQESTHYVLGSEYNFTAWNRPFKYTTEVYYKRMKNLIPYELDNVRIRYYAENLASGYAAGLDMKLHGEFVPGVESWMSFSLMKTEETIEGLFYTDTQGNKTPAGSIPRPTDQRINFNMFFQDFLPRNPSYKVQLAFVYGSGLPFGPPTFERQLDTLRMPSYKRVDIGFSKLLISQDSQLSERSPFRHLESMWITAEIFNLLEINNTISFLWIKDVENRLFAIPNYLTSRLINIKLIARF